MAIASLVLTLAAPASAADGAAEFGPIDAGARSAAAEADAGARSHRPPPGPSLRERSSRGRRANPASGALFIAVIVVAIGYYVVKKFKR
jgi:hypothetical protein